MEFEETSPNVQTVKTKVSANDPARLFYLGAALLLLILTFISFHHFYLHGRSYQNEGLNPDRLGMIITHGVVMTAWMLLFVAQTWLIVSGNRRVHRTLGFVSTFVALCVLVSGIRLAFPLPLDGSAKDYFYGLSHRQFNGFILFNIVIFAAFVAIGVWKRRRPAIHRSMMLLSMLAVMTAVIDRIPWMVSLYIDTVWSQIFGPFSGPVVLAFLLLGQKSLLTKTWDRWLTICCVAFTCASAFVIFFVKTSAWESVANLLSRGP